MKKPQHLKKGDTIALVSLSRGLLGESFLKHRVELGINRLKKEYGLKIKIMPNAMKGSEYLYKHPEARAKDLMDAFLDKEVKAVICDIGGEDTIRILPYVNLNIIKNNPKIFTGFSDTTVNHLMMYKAGLISYYGASFLCNFCEYVKINDYTKKMIDLTLFHPRKNVEIFSSSYYYDDEDPKVWWDKKNLNLLKPYHKEEIGYEVLQGKGKVRGRLLGGCIDTFIYLIGTPIWPKLKDFKDKILFLETSEENIEPSYLRYLLRNLMAQGVFNVIKGIIFGKPARRSRYEDYKKEIISVIGFESKHPELPIITNVNFGHAEPIGVIPYGVMCELDLDNKRIILLEKATR